MGRDDRPQPAPPTTPTTPTDREARLLREVAELSRRLLAASPERLDREIEASLRQAAVVAGADRAYLTVFGRRGEPSASYEWILEGLEARLPEEDPDSRTTFPWASAQITAGIPIVCRDPKELPDEAVPEREQMIRRGVRSLLTLPIQPTGRVIGFQIFECLTEPHDWSPAEISLVRVMSEILASHVIARRTEQALRDSEARFRAMADNAPHIVTEIGSRGEVLYISPRVEEIMGYEPEGVRNASAISYLHPDDQRPMREMIGALVRGEAASTTVRVRHANGSWRWFEMTGQAFESEAGERRFVVASSDVTVQRQLEIALRESQAQLFQSQKMEAVGRLAGGVAHDFNNLLLVIGGNVQQVIEGQALAEPARTAAHDALDAVDRAASLTRQLLSFSRRDLLDSRSVDLSEVVRSLLTLLERLLGEQVTLHVELEPPPAVVRGDRGQLEQVLVNLAVNARDAMPGGGDLFIRTSTREIDDEAAGRLGLERGGPHRVLTVKDTGVGIDPRAADHIFEPFYTTKEPGQGTGLGLSIVYSVAHQAGGTVRVEGAPGRGATFEVLLPAAEPMEADPPDADAPAPGPARGRLLLVEDEPAVRRLVTRMLTRRGYDVVVAANGADALERIDDPGVPIDLLITDVVMPGISGPELARRLRLRFSKLAVLFVSGYPRDFQPANMPSDEAFLAKPFTQEQLMRAVAGLLEGESG